MLNAFHDFSARIRRHSNVLSRILSHPISIFRCFQTAAAGLKAPQGAAEIRRTVAEAVIAGVPYSTTLKISQALSDLEDGFVDIAEVDGGSDSKRIAANEP